MSCQLESRRFLKSVVGHYPCISLMLIWFCFWLIWCCFSGLLLLFFWSVVTVWQWGFRKFLCSVACFVWLPGLAKFSTVVFSSVWLVETVGLFALFSCVVCYFWGLACGLVVGCFYFVAVLGFGLVERPFWLYCFIIFILNV